MVVADRQTIISEIDSHISKNGGQYRDWYVGIAADPVQRLFNDHNVTKDGDAWIYREAASSTIAREIEEHFVNHKKTDGGPGGGDEQTKFIYAYKKSYHTKQ